MFSGVNFLGWTFFMDWISYWNIRYRILAFQNLVTIRFQLKFVPIVSFFNGIFQSYENWLNFQWYKVNVSLVYILTGFLVRSTRIVNFSQCKVLKSWSCRIFVFFSAFLRGDILDWNCGVEFEILCNFVARRGILFDFALYVDNFLWFMTVLIREKSFRVGEPDNFEMRIIQFTAFSRSFQVYFIF